MHARMRAHAMRRIGRMVALLLQVALVALSLQMTGALHIVADVVFDDAHSDCDGGAGDDDDCPPGCPTCHTCAHAQVPYVSRAEVVPGAWAHFVLRRERVSAAAPPSQPPGSVFRPPRA